MGACVPSDSFRITGLLTTNCATIDHTMASGDDHGGIAVSASTLFVTGDDATARMAAADLTGLTALSTQHTALFNDLQTEEVYVLLEASGTQPEGALVPESVTQLGRLDPMTGELSATRIPLSMAISVDYGTAIMSGFGEVLLGVPDSGFGPVDLQWWHIALPSGEVTRLGTTPEPTRRSCESWAWWGIAERFDDVRYALYVESSTRISRMPIPMSGAGTGVATEVAAFTDLADMCSITFSRSRNRWYFHHEGMSQFSATRIAEIAGSCDGTWDRP